MILDPEVKDIFGFTFDSFTLTDYNPHPHIKGAVAI
jgi:thymidylate synthase